MLSLLLLPISAPHRSVDIAEKFQVWKAQHARSYATPELELTALMAFEQNEQLIKQHNAKKLSWALGHNSYSDISSEVFFRNRLGYRKPVKKRSPRYEVLHSPANKSVDWVTAGKVTPIKDQADCGSCWAFSTIGGIESAFAIATGKLVSLSEQELVSCDSDSRCKNCGCMGCQGGNMDYAEEYAEQNAICEETAFPYVSGTGLVPQCRSKCTGLVKVTKHLDVPKGDEATLLKAAATKPVIVAIEADKSIFHLYKSGIIDGECGDNLDHGVLVVGYGDDTTLGKPYWKIKNSWGADWGEHGFVRLVRNKNMCGLADDATYPANVTAVAPIPPPSPPTPAPPLTHYGNPAIGLGCLNDEVVMNVSGISGNFCSPTCEFGTYPKKCPGDLPTSAGASIVGNCLIGGMTDRNCVMECDSHQSPDPCPKGASCKSGGTVSICTYDTNSTAAAGAQVEEA